MMYAIVDDCGQIPMSCGSVCMLLALFMVSLCKKYYQFFLGMFRRLITLTWTLIPFAISPGRSTGRGHVFRSDPGVRRLSSLL